MGAWSTLEGEITYPVNKHISVRKAVQEYMKQCQGEWYFKADRYREVKDIAYVSFYMTYEFENMDAANFFNKLVEHLESIGCRSRLNADIPFWS